MTTESIGQFNLPYFWQMGNNFWDYTPAFTGTSTSAGSKSKTYEELLKEQKEKAEKENAERENKLRIIDFRNEQAEEIQRTRDLISCTDVSIEAINSGKKEDGSAVVNTAYLEGPVVGKDGKVEAPKPKKKSSWEKWCGSAWASLKSLGKAFIGMDEDGKINWKKAATNLAITAAAVGACFIPYVGPVIGYGLLAYGVGTAGVNIYKGVKKLNRLSNTEEEDEMARQEICSGAIIGTLSAVGLKGMGRTASMAAKASGATNAGSKGISALAKSRTGIGKPVEYLSQGTRDILVNPLKATGQAMKADRALIASKGGGIKGFAKAYGSKVQDSWAGLRRYQNNYNNRYSQLENALTRRKTELTTKISTETNASKRALLQEELKMVENNLNELHSIGRSVKTKSDFEKLRENNSALRNQELLEQYPELSRGYEIQGRPINAKRYEAFREQMETSQGAYQNELEALIKSKEAYMRSCAKKPAAHRRELNEYTEKARRAKYNTREKLDTGIEALNKKIANFETKITELEEKIANARSASTKTRYKNQLNAVKQQLTAAEDELAFCNTIKFRSNLNPHTWGKNEYQLAIGGSNHSTRATLGSAVKSPVTPAAMAYSDMYREYSEPFSFDVAELTPEQVQEYLRQLETEKASLEQAVLTIQGIDDPAKWDALKVQLEQAKKQEEKAPQTA